MTRWLLTGGAGYIGAHVLYELRSSGREVVVFDDLSTGRQKRIPNDVPFIRGDIRDGASLEGALRKFDVDGVIHLAAKKSVAESVAEPLLYYQNNVVGTLNLLSAMHAVGVRRIVFSSSASVYGEPDSLTVSETDPTNPSSPYGESKLIGELMARSFVASTQHTQTPASLVVLRYFNVAGAGQADLGDTSAANLIPMAFRAIDVDSQPQIFGGDYPTRDGSCVRDYVHVSDLARAHVIAAKRCETIAEPSSTFNIGSGHGYTVREVLDVVATVTGKLKAPEVTARRPGDPATLVADTSRALEELGWIPRLGLDSMVRSAWEARAATHEE